MKSEFIFNVKGDIPGKSALWMTMLFTLFLFILILLGLGIPRDIQQGAYAETAIKELDGMVYPLLKIKETVSRMHFSDDVSGVKSELAKLHENAISLILHNEEVGSYSFALIESLESFKQAYTRWINAERGFLGNYYEVNGRLITLETSQQLSMEASENNTLFLSMMYALSDCETVIHGDIAKGRQALRILQYLGLLLVLYFFTVIVIYQHQSNRVHARREKNLEVTLRSIGEAVIATDISGAVTCMNPEAERLTGWDFKNAKGKALAEVFNVVDGNSGEPIGDLVEHVKQENRIVVLAEESMLIASNGNRYHIYENGAPIYDEAEKIIGVVLVFRDITHSHQLKCQLNDNATRLQRIVDSSMDAVIAVDEKGLIKEWNPAAEQIFGWSYDEIKKVPIHDLIIPEEFKAQHLQGVQLLIQSEQTTFHAKRIISKALHRDGHMFPIELAMTSIRTEQGWLLNAFIRDLTEQKNSEDEIARNNILLEETQRIAKLGYWELDLINDKLEWSDEIYRIFAMDPHQDKPSYDLFMKAIHPDDRAAVDSAYSESIKYKTPYNIIHRVVTGEGIKIVHEQCDTTYDENDKPIRSLGLVHDITERVNTLDELRLAATTFRAHAGILITDKIGIIVRVNPAFEEMTGYSSQELVGANPSILKSGKQSEAFYREMWQKVADRGVWQGELWNKRKDGSLYAEWLTITSVKDDSGEVTHYVGTSQDITERKKVQTQIEYLAYHDDLTDLANRRLLHDRLHQSIAACKRHEELGAVLMLDLDQFKDLNDSLGHSVGDEVLRQVASRLKALVRDGDTVARLGGDEFVVVLSAIDKNISKVGYEVQSIAEKIRRRLSETYEYTGGTCYSNVSIGISLFPEDTDDIDDILKHADTALYRAKEQGRNTVCFYQPHMQVEVDLKLSIGDGLRKALINNELSLHYQPQLNETGELLGAEALIRWEHPEQGMISPDKFIPVAEDSGLILEIGEWVLKEAARQMAEWQTAEICKQGMLRLSINVSSRQFRQPDFVSQVLRVFKQAGVSPKCIELEVTESLLMDDLEMITEKMSVLQSYGIRISIDDFGTGYSSLSYLKRLPLDQLKIDQSFVRDIAHDVNDAVVVETIISMAHHMGLQVIAEGVETRGQLDFLIAGGCTIFQGYYFSRPLTAESFMRYVKKNNDKCIPCQAANG